MSDASQTGPISAPYLSAFSESIKETLEVSQTAATEIMESAQDDSEKDLQTEQSENTFAHIPSKQLKKSKSESVKVERAKNVQESILVRKEDADGLADQFSQRQGNREYRLDPRLLSALLTDELGVSINAEADEEALIAAVRAKLTVNGQNPDVAMVDKALEFLLESSRAQLPKIVGPAKEQLGRIIAKLETARYYYRETHAVEIRVAEKIIGAVDAAVETSHQNIHETLGRYREMVHTPPDLQTLRKAYEAKGYKYMMLELKGLSAYLGANLKREHLENPELFQLASSARKMQALLQVFRQAKNSIPAMESYLAAQGLWATAA